jgi:hypothetical protein
VYENETNVSSKNVATSNTTSDCNKIASPERNHCFLDKKQLAQLLLLNLSEDIISMI